MNWRYLVGKSLADFGNFILCSRLMPSTRLVPQGLSYPYDIKRFYHHYQIKTILDVGANIGQTSLFLTRHFPQADIFSFEPVHETYEILIKNTRNSSSIKPFNYALGSKEGSQIIQIRENSELNTLVQSNAESFLGIDKSETVTIKTVDNFCKLNQINKIDILKMDVQGYELEVLSGAEYYLQSNLVNFIYAEVGFERSNKECQYFSELNEFLEKNNFRFSGFYEIFRWGENKRYFGFCNALFVNCSL